MEKCYFMVAWSKVFQTGRNSVALYHCDSYGLLLASRALGATGCCWLGGWFGLVVGLTLNIPDVFNMVPYNTVRPSFATLI